MRMTNTHQDVRMYRFLACTTICDERFAISVQHAKESFTRFVLHVTDSERETNFRQKLRFFLK